MSDVLTIKSSKFTYNVEFVDDFASALASIIKAGDTVILDANVYDLYKQRIDKIIPSIDVILLTPSEQQKSYQGVEQVIGELIQKGFRKNNRLIAVGGGITQDVTAFIASVIFRGVDWFFVPTTLLAQCDSCVGSKTSINFGEYKNQLGGFYPPTGIILDVGFMDSLSEKEFRSGMGEMIHFFLVSGEEDFIRLEKDYDSAFEDKMVLRELIHRSLQIKKRYVELDEFDQGPRIVFNYGHTFGHAIESLTNYRIPHGVAVSIGMDIANYLSVYLGLINHDVRERIQRLLKKVWLDTKLAEIDISNYIEALRKDKKAIGKEVNVILTKGMGEMFKTPLPITSDIERLLQSYFSEFDKLYWR